ncbi:hypothetical protein LINPERHAP1_LOCUS29632, partial [Linum perenne]
TISAREGRQQLGEKLLLLELIPKASNATVLKIGKIKAARIVGLHRFMNRPTTRSKSQQTKNKSTVTSGSSIPAKPKQVKTPTPS